MIKKWLIRAFMLSLITFLITIGVKGATTTFREKSSQKELNLFVWGAFLSPETISSFENKYKIKVHLHLCSNNEEMLGKLKRSKPGSFDLVFASDYAIKKIRQSDLALKIDHSRLDFYDRITPMLLNLEYDPGNQYSVPYGWEVYGIAENHSLMTPPKEATFDELFIKTSGGQKVVMTPDPIEAFSIGAYYLHGKISSLSEREIKQVKALLKKQKRWVEAYADYRAKYLVVTENCPVAIVKSSFLADLTRESPEISYRLPKEATFTSVENLFIPKGAKNVDMAYAFMNHVFNKEEYKKNYELCAILPSCLDAIDDSIIDIKVIHELIEIIKERNNIVFFDYVLPPKELLQAWIEVKS